MQIFSEGLFATQSREIPSENCEFPAQFLAVLENGASCFADFSYLAPDKLGYELPQYLRVIVYGTKGMADASYALPHLTVVIDEDTVPQMRSAAAEPFPGYLQEFLEEITSINHPHALTTHHVLHATRHALEAQAIAHQSIA